MKYSVLVYDIRLRVTTLKIVLQLSGSEGNVAKVGWCTVCLMCSFFKIYIIYSVVCSAVLYNFYL
jgi:hypothetical protein